MLCQDASFTMVNQPKKREASLFRNKIDFSGQVDANKERICIIGYLNWKCAMNTNHYC